MHLFLVPDDVRHLMRHEDDLRASRNFEMIFPTAGGHRYLKYFDQPRYYNHLLIAWERKFGGNRVKGWARLRSEWEKIVKRKQAA